MQITRKNLKTKTSRELVEAIVLEGQKFVNDRELKYLIGDEVTDRMLKNKKTFKKVFS